jgi:hypothetical protein
VTSEFTFLHLCQSVSVSSIIYYTTGRKMIIDHHYHNDMYILSQIWLSNVVLNSVLLMFINEFASGVFVVQQYGETNSDLSVAAAEEAQITNFDVYISGAIPILSGAG